jgi:surface polysaccharide O-acyltransferase-like enzyme
MTEMTGERIFGLELPAVPISLIHKKDETAYMFDDALVLGVGIFTLSQRRLQEKEGRWLKLVSGGVMIILGVYLLAARHSG